MATDKEQALKISLDKMSFEDSPKSPTILPWDRFQNWVHCICVVTFDLELGQAMEVRIQRFDAVDSMQTTHLTAVKIYKAWVITILS